MRTPLILAAAFAFMGCYTQLYTGGYAQRTVEPNYYQQRSGADSVADSTLAASESAESPRDTLYKPGTVVVNNYYRESPYYRGYSIDSWDYPYVSFSLYSGRYRDYCDPWWWHDEGYRRSYSPGYYGGYRGGTTTTTGGGSSNYQSDKRIFAPTYPQPELHKGRRSEPAQAAPAPAPKAAEESPAVVESTNASGNGDRHESSGGSSGDHPSLHKGRRR